MSLHDHNMQGMHIMHRATIMELEVRLAQAEAALRAIIELCPPGTANGNTFWAAWEIARDALRAKET